MEHKVTKKKEVGPPFRWVLDCTCGWHSEAPNKLSSIDAKTRHISLLE